MQHQPRSKPLKLSPRKIEVLTAVAEGLSGGEIAAKLGLSPNTVRTYMMRIHEELGVSKRIMAVAKAKELGLI